MVGTLASTDAQFQKAGGTSAHYGIEDANIHQYVDEKNTAYHAGAWTPNLTSIGIEHSAAPNRPASDATYQTSIALCKELCAKYNLNPDTDIIPHNSIVATQCPGTIDINRIKAGVKENDMPNDGDIDNAYLRANHRKATEEEKAFYRSKPWSAPDGLFYGKTLVDFENTENAVIEARKSADSALGIANVRDGYLKDIGTSGGFNFTVVEQPQVDLMKQKISLSASGVELKRGQYYVK